MHELSLCEAIADSARRHADGRPITGVTVQVGYLRQVVPDALQFAWEVLTSGTELDGAALTIEHVPAAIECNRCHEETGLDVPVMVCAACGASDVSVLAGEELLLVSLELAEV